MRWPAREVGGKDHAPGLGNQACNVAHNFPKARSVQCANDTFSAIARKIADDRGFLTSLSTASIASLGRAGLLSAAAGRNALSTSQSRMLWSGFFQPRQL